MRKLFWIVVFLLIFVETAIKSGFPYYAIAVSFTGYIAYKKGFNSLIFASLIGVIVGLGGSHIVRDVSFFVLMAFIMMQVYNLFYFEKINIIIISFIETVIYVSYIYFFKMHEVQFAEWAKEFVYIMVYSYLFSTIDKNIK